MGNLRLGQTRTFAALAAAGTGACAFMDWTDNTGFAPIPAVGVWLLGASPFLLVGGSVDGAGVFQTSFTTPNVPSLVGFEVSTQALLIAPGVGSLSHPDIEVIEQ